MSDTRQANNNNSLFNTRPAHHANNMSLFDTRPAHHANNMSLFDTRPAHHANNIKSLFKNPWSPVSDPRTTWLPNLSRFAFEWATQHQAHPHNPVKTVNPDFATSSNTDTIKATWLGHASFLLEFNRLSKLETPPRILFDPMFSERAGPSPWAGIRRRLPPPCSIRDLPEFHFVVYSHNHYDHLDLPSLQSIYQLKGNNVTFLVPLGNKQWFLDSGIPSDQVLELDWWEEVALPVPDAAGFNSETMIKFICTPAQHTSGRGVTDIRTTLWSSWVAELVLPKSESKLLRTAAFFAGDTGYMTAYGPCPAFKEIGDKYGPFDVAMLPIWRGGTLSFIARMGLRLMDSDLLSSFHATPHQALCIHKDIRARHSLAMHFATFAGSDIEAFDPIVELTKRREELNIGDWMQESGFGVIDVGETACIVVGVD